MKMQLIALLALVVVFVGVSESRPSPSWNTLGEVGGYAAGNDAASVWANTGGTYNGGSFANAYANGGAYASGMSGYGMTVAGLDSKAKARTGYSNLAFAKTNTAGAADMGTVNTWVKNAATVNGPVRSASSSGAVQAAGNGASVSMTSVAITN